MSILQMSLYGTVLILVITAVRAVGLQKLPKRTFVFLWDIVLLRLFLPWSIPSPFSIYALAPPEISAGAPQAALVREGVRETSYVVTPSSATAAAAPAATAGTLSGEDIARIIWLVGAAILAVWFAATYIRCLREFRTSLPVTSEPCRQWLKTHPLRRGLALRQSDQLSVPLTYGIFHPVIVLPKNILLETRENVEFVLSHEYMHVRHFDALQKMLLAAALCVHWFNPAVWIMYILANRDLELACDEAVLQSRRSDSRSAYARMLIAMEEMKSHPMPFCSSFGRGASTERIVSIMKIQKKSIVAIVAAGALAVGITTAFATSAPPVRNAEYGDDLTQGQADGSWALSVDDSTAGAADQIAYPDVEWWTEEEYAAWLEDEKTALQALLGTSAWTNTDGHFTWTQEKIDETVAMYEETLEQIRHGLRVSKSVNGSDDVVLSAESEGFVTPDPSPEDLREYARFGLTKSDGILKYEGEDVRFFFDDVEIDEEMFASRTTYFNADGTVNLRTVRRETVNPDGSTDPFGELIGIERITDAEADKLVAVHITTTNEAIAVEDTLHEVTSVENSVSTDNDVETAQLLDEYAPFGLTYSKTDGRLHMRWNGRDVHSLYDPLKAVWIANNMFGSELTDPVDLEAVYIDGKLSDLRETSLAEQNAETTVVFGAADDNASAADTGITFSEKFVKYTAFGLAWEEIHQDGGTRYVLTLNGNPVNRLSDEAPDGSAFSFESSVQKPDGLSVRAVYTDGKLSGLQPA